MSEKLILLGDYIVIECERHPGSTREPLRGIIKDKGPDTGREIGEEILCANSISLNGIRAIVKASSVIGVYKKGE